MDRAFVHSVRDPFFLNSLRALPLRFGEESLCGKKRSPREKTPHYIVFESMCKLCLREPFPERGRTVLESGFYLVNFLSCVQCGQRSQSLFQGREAIPQVEQVDGAYEETIEFDHKCDACQHVIAPHYYQFKVITGEAQEYLMSCSLCGKGEDSTLVHARQDKSSTVVVLKHAEPESMSKVFAGLQLNLATTAAQDDGSEGEWD